RASRAPCETTAPTTMTASRRRMSSSPWGMRWSAYPGVGTMNLKTIPLGQSWTNVFKSTALDAWRTWKRGERVHTLPARGSIPQQESLVVAPVEIGTIGSSPIAGAIALIAVEGHVVGGQVRVGPVKLTLGQLRRIRRRRLAVRPRGPKIATSYSDGGCGTSLGGVGNSRLYRVGAARVKRFRKGRKRLHILAAERLGGRIAGRNVHHVA